MSVRLHFNSAVTDAPVGNSLFTCAEKLGIPVPTSCNKQGKCKECVIEVTEGMDCLSRPGAQEEGTVRCHTMRRGTMKIEKHAFELPTGPRSWQLDPAVTRDGDRVLLDG